MFARFSRSWSLVKASAAVLAKDKELLVFPLLSTLCTLMVIAAFALPMFGLGLLDGLDGSDTGIGAQAGAYALAFLFYLVQYFVIFFFNSALVGAVMIRLDGGDPGLGDGLRIAGSKVVPILGYALIAATVGMILRAIQERAGWLGRILGGLLGVAWTVASFLVVPVLVTRDIGPLDAVRESALLLKKTWGENLIGQGGIGLVFGFIYAVLIVFGIAATVAAGVAQSAMAVIAVVVLFVLALVLAGLIQAALSGIYSAALYRYACGAGQTTGFDTTLLERAFKVKA
jgi:hypothetical protein